METDWAGIAYITALGISTTLALCLSALAWVRRTQPGATILSLLSLLTAIMSASSALEPVAPTLWGKEFWVNVQYFGYCFIPVGYLALALQQAGLYRWLTRRQFAPLSIIPAFTVMAAWTNDLHHLIRLNLHFEPAGGLLFLGEAAGPWLWIQLIYSTAIISLAFIVLLLANLHAPALYRTQALLVLLGGALPLVWEILYMHNSPLSPRMDLAPAVASISLLLVGVAVLRLGLCGLVPVARDQAFESMRDGVLILDEQGRIMDLNLAAERALGITRASVVSRPLAKVHPPLGELLAGTADGRSGGEHKMTLSVQGVDRRWHVRVSPLAGSATRAGGRVALLEDITVEEAAAVEHEYLAQRAREARRLTCLSLLAGGVAHRFNNLLTTIMARSDLASMTLPPASPAREHLEHLEEAAQRAGELAGQMLAYSGKGPFLPRPLDLTELVRETVPLLAAELTEAVSIDCRLNDGLLPISADRAQVQQVIVQLVTNALESTERGGTITIATEMRQIDGHLGCNCCLHHDIAAGRYAALRVADTGCGMDEETKAHIFDPFFSTKFTGRGLGLAAVQGIVRGHQGAIFVESQPGEGAVFTVLLPCVPDDEEM